MLNALFFTHNPEEGYINVEVAALMHVQPPRSPELYNAKNKKIE
jgi:hypothetical protein